MKTGAEVCHNQKMLQIDQLLQNRYRVARVLGQGGMGAVYQAHDLSLDVICVVKEMLPPPDLNLVKNMAAQFHREGKILASLRHMSLPRVSNYFVENDNYYMVMDLIEGRSLEKLIGDNGLPESIVLTYADQLLDVLSYIHGKGILHRDIKPANIIVQPDGRVVLVDFGLVKIINTGGPATKTLVNALTPQYAPPEQYTGNTDQRSDLYSLAATLYQALAGQPPASATDQFSGVRLQPLRQFPHLAAGVSPNTDYVLMKALALDRGQRYQDAASMRTELISGVRVPSVSQPQTPPVHASVETQVWSPAPPAEPLPATPAVNDATVRPAGTAPRPSTPVSSVNVPAPTSGAAASVVAAPKKQSKGLLIGGIIVGVLVLGCFALSRLPFMSALVSGVAGAPTVQSDGKSTPIPLDLTNTPKSAVAVTAPKGRSTASPKATPKVTTRATATPVPQTDATVDVAGIEATVAAEIDVAATEIAGTPLAADERYLELAPGIEIALARVPAGEFVMGSADSDKDAAHDEKPQHTVTVGEYWIAVDDITVEQFAAFVQATGYKTTAETLGTGLVFNSASALVQVKGASWRQPGGAIDSVPNDLDYPVVQVSWDDANAFCLWASKVSGRRVRLPSEAQWEKAARGTDARLYPWGNTPPESNLLNFDNQVGNVEPVASHSPDGDSPYGLSDMAGNVWQWTSSLALPYPYAANDGREDTTSRENRVLRGGAFRNGFIPSAKNNVRSAARGVAEPTSRNVFISFRVVVLP